MFYIDIYDFILVLGNRNFELNVDFSSSFRLLLGGKWYAAEETIFVLSCMVQACTAIVQVAQCIDSMLGSFFLQQTFALQLWPSLELLTWSGASCRHLSSAAADTLPECTPFYDGGPVIISLGYILVVLFFLPMSMRHLNETIWFQVAAFWAMFFLVLVFDWQFIVSAAGNTTPLVWWGNDFTQIGGVVLFNYAYSVTVPAWLAEKKTDVSVNHTIWGAALLSTIIYITFGILSSRAFEDPGENILVMLGSQQVIFVYCFCF
jgi:hypothetical protein